jgi:hypothetical protein
MAFGVLFAIAVGALNAQVTKSYDKFKDQTTVAFGTVIAENFRSPQGVNMLSGPLSMNFESDFMGHMPGQRPERFAVELDFPADKNGNSYCPCFPLDLLVDGERFNLSPQPGIFVVYLFPYDMVQKMANARSVEGRLHGELEFALTGKQKQELRQFLSLVTP